MPDLSTSALTLYVERQLMDQSAAIYDAPLPPLNAIELMPNRNTVALGSRTFNRRVRRMFGASAWVTGNGQDLPRVDLGVIEDIYNVGMHGCMYSYTIGEIRAAVRAGEDLESGRAMAGRRAILERNNDTAWFGSVEKDITGLLSIPYIPRATIDAAVFSSATDADVTLAAMYALEQSIEEDTLEAHRPDLLLMAPELYNYVATTRASTLNEDTILKVYERNALYAKRVVKVRELRGAGPAGEDVIACVSSEHLEHNIPDPLTIIEPTIDLLETKIPMISETAGVITQYPYAHIIAEVS